MRLHRNAKTTPQSRIDLVHRIEAEGHSVSEVAEALGVSRRTVYKWLRRYREEGLAGLEDRRSAPHRVRRRTSPARVRRIVELRRKRRTGWQISQRLRMAPSTVHAVLRREGLARLSALEPKPTVRRYERNHPGELVHLDTKPLARIHRVGHRIHGDRSLRVYGAGWEYAHVAIDDASRLAYAEVLGDQKGETAVAFFERARQWFAGQRIRIERVMTDNGSCYVSRRFRQALKRHDIRHLRTRAYRPQTNGKAERFIGTLVRGWAYGRPYRTSNQRTRALPKWLRYYNHERPHRSLGMITPSQRSRRDA
jgi:transposase InsO family protein